MVTPLGAAGKKLDKWLDDHAHTRSWLCGEIGVASSVLWRWLVRYQRPRVDFAVAIEQLTGGDVPASMWEPPIKPKKKTAREASGSRKKAA